MSEVKVGHYNLYAPATCTSHLLFITFRSESHTARLELEALDPYIIDYTLQYNQNPNRG